MHAVIVYCNLLTCSTEMRPEFTPLVSASFDDAVNSTGWGQLNITTLSPQLPLSQLWYAAGFAEGKLTAERIEQTAYNAGMDTLPPELAKFIRDNLAWMQAQVAAHAQPQDTWQQVGLLLEQARGIADGMASVRPATALSFEQIVQLQARWDYSSIYRVLHSAPPLPRGAVPPGTPMWLRPPDSCSVAVAMEEGLGVVVGHTTWSPAGTMLRVWKRYSGAAFGGGLSLAGYFGLLSSGDDFYVVTRDGGAVGQTWIVTETTLDENPDALRPILTPQSLLYWCRHLAALRLAVTPMEFADRIAVLNSGTYNNQWIIVGAADTTAPTLVVAEQMPGVVTAVDLTRLIRAGGVWTSYNVPAFAASWDLSNNKLLVGQPGGWYYNYTATTRARMFQHAVAAHASQPWTVAQVSQLLRHNSWLTDADAKSPAGDSAPAASPHWPLSCRGDLAPAGATCPSIVPCTLSSEVGTDVKVSSTSLLLAGVSARAVCGPTQDGVPPFSWATTPLKDRHAGHPVEFNFSWITV